MKMIVYSHEPEILKESWSSFLQQQQQQDPPASSDPPADDVIETPFDKINRAEMDDEQIAILDKSKEDYIKLVKDNRALSSKVVKVEGVASKYQSEADRAKAELQRLQAPKPQDEPKTQKQARAFLAKHGLKGEDLEKQLPFFTDMIASAVQIAKEEIGQDLGPMAGTVLEQQGTNAFTAARQMSQALQDPEVAQEVWDKFVVPEIQAGRPVNPAAVGDYAKIVYFDKGKHTQHQATPPPAVTPPRANPNTGFTFPGATVLPPGNLYPGQHQNNQPAAPDSETSAALTAVFSRMTSGSNVKWPSGIPKPNRR